MSFNFFTFGGSNNWGDIFFYQKWRIQRHVNTTDYRLLDPWDISRQEGPFEDCRKKFVKYIDAYQLSRQKGPMIIMLHGFCESKKVFRPLWREATQRGFLAAALNYPSTKAPLDSHIKQLDFFLNNIEDVSEISFVVKGSSCLILRKLFSLPSDWHKKLEIKRILFVDPANTGNDFADWLAKFRIFRWFLGPMAQEISAEEALLIPKIPSNIEQGTIFCDSPFRKLIRKITKPFESINTNPDSLEETYATKSITVYTRKKDIFSDKKILKHSINFLEKGEF